ncbi:AVAST type 1 anti-phage system MBL fold metallo-hydrolase Avs1a [Sphingobacterium sp. MYb388]|uniref:AVAST type 1 anti-phage system MBL fold metallo-hydrolase Avs1a n=1 Tax=Sphingobacterium sp. MYb388 TaxID=2745437 RepID=UPI0030B6D704
MNISIIAYPAKNGDCFLISFHDKKEQKHILVDCGYAATIKKNLKDDLIKISLNGGLLDKLILTHIDADHIQGAIRLLKENNSERFIEIKEIWHNAFRHLFEKNQIDINEKESRILRQIILRGYPKKPNILKDEQEISAKQGTTVGALILQGKYSWNSDFNGNAISTDYGREIVISENSNLFLLSPDREKLNKLKKLWSGELERYGINYNNGSLGLYDDAFEMLMSWEKAMNKKRPTKISATEDTLEELLNQPFEEDTTATNGSSIAFILKIEEKKLLFLADAHPDLIVKSLKDFQKNGIIMFDFIKVSHHGSFNNISKDLLETIDAHNYLISTNGASHNHPDKKTIAHIINRPVGFHRKIYFNYKTDNSKFFDRGDWKKTHNYSIHYLDQAPFTLSL